MPPKYFEVVVGGRRKKIWHGYARDVTAEIRRRYGGDRVLRISFSEYFVVPILIWEFGGVSYSAVVFDGSGRFVTPTLYTYYPEDEEMNETGIWDRFVPSDFVDMESIDFEDIIADEVIGMFEEDKLLLHPAEELKLRSFLVDAEYPICVEVDVRGVYESSVRGVLLLGRKGRKAEFEAWL